MKALLIFLFASLSLVAQVGPGGCIYTEHCATISWTASTTPNSTYTIYRAIGTGTTNNTPCTITSTAIQLNTVPVTTLSYLDTTVAQTGGATYCYGVIAISNNSPSAFSVGVTAIVPATFPASSLGLVGVQ